MNKDEAPHLHWQPMSTAPEDRPILVMRVDRPSLDLLGPRVVKWSAQHGIFILVDEPDMGFEPGWLTLWAECPDTPLTSAQLDQVRRGLDMVLGTRGGELYDSPPGPF